MINCRLSKISGLDAVGVSLLHLSLGDQQITKIEGLAALVSLRNLCLQQNCIEKIEGLEQCVYGRRRASSQWLDLI